MGFGSAIFLFGFLPLTVLLFHLLPRPRGRQVLLIAASLVFYAFGRLWDVPILLASVAVHYVAGRLLLRLERGRRAVVAAAVALDLLLLLACKYLTFFGTALGQALGAAWTVPSLPLPLGVSFFTFQGISYVVDGYRDRGQLSRRFLPVLQYLTFFPNLVSGPLARFCEVGPMLARMDRPDGAQTASAPPALCGRAVEEGAAGGHAADSDRRHVRPGRRGPGCPDGVAGGSFVRAAAVPGFQRIQ